MAACNLSSMIEASQKGTKGEQKTDRRPAETSRGKKEPDFDAPSDAGPEEGAGESAADAGSSREGAEAEEREARRLSSNLLKATLGRAEEGGKGQSALATEPGAAADLGADPFGVLHPASK